MINKLLELTNSYYPLEEINIHEYSHFKVGPITFDVANYKAQGLGHITTMKGKGLFGLMKMDTFVINPFEKDMVLYSYDRILALKNDSLYQECYDTLLDETKKESIDSSLQTITDHYKQIPSITKGPLWYDDIRLHSSVIKKTKTESRSLDEFAIQYLTKYLELSKEMESCDPTKKKQKADEYTQGLLTHGGPSTDMFLKKKGKEFTESFYNDIFFHTKP